MSKAETIATWLQVGFLAIVSTVSGIRGYMLYADPEHPTALPGNLVIEVPSSLKDSSGPLTIQNLTWIETHGPPGDQISSGFPPTAKLPRDPAAGIPRVAVAVNLNRPAASDIRAFLYVDIPEGAQYSADCETLTAGLNCEEPRDVQRLSTNKILTKHVIGVEGFVPKGQSVIGMTLDLKGLQGLGFSSSREQTGVRFPFLMANDNGFLPATTVQKEPISVQLTLGIPDADQMSWSGTSPTARFSQGAYWTYKMLGGEQALQTGSFLPASPATGVQQSVLDADSNHTFYAGLLLGIAGSALIGCIQMALKEIGRLAAREDRGHRDPG